MKPEINPSKPSSRWHKPWVYLGLLAFLLLLGVILYNIPGIHERAVYHLAVLRSKVFYYFNPPSANVFDPIGEASTTQPVNTQEPTDLPEATATLQPVTVSASVTATPTPAPLPPAVNLDNILLQPQAFNNCGPATLSMNLSFWGWEGNQSDIQKIIKPRLEDLAVTPEELVSYVESHTPYRAVLRYAGDLDLVKRFVAAGIPVLVERGYYIPSDGWMGHFGVINGYDDASQTVHIPDSFSGVIDFSYADLELYWAQFFNTFIVVFPPEREPEVLNLLGEQSDRLASLENALELSVQRAESETGREQYFAVFNQGVILTLQGNYPQAAQAFDRAFALYRDLYEEDRPWRLIWYQEYPYMAYYHTGRYQDVVNLATATIDATPNKGLPESYLWMGRAQVALGQEKTAAFNFKRALTWHPNWPLAVAELEKLGEAP
jgi:tetratricopeptide (TPR) repeat protein